MVAESEPAAEPLAAHALSAPFGAKPVCSLNSVLSIERHWLASTPSAVTSSLSCTHVTTARTWSLDPSGDRSEQAAVGLPLASESEFATRSPFAASGTVAHRSAGTSGCIGFSGCGSDPPQPESSRNAPTTTPSRARLRAVRGITHPPPGSCSLLRRATFHHSGEPWRGLMSRPGESSSSQGHGAHLQQHPGEG